MTASCEHLEDIEKDGSCDEAHALGHRQLQGLKDLFDTGNLADFVVTCKDGERIKTHKAVLYSQSGYFKSAFSVNMKESFEGVIHLPELPQVIRTMLSYMYTSEYDFDKAAAGLPPFQFHARVYAAALKYQIPCLQSAARKAFSRHGHSKLFDGTPTALSSEESDFLKAVLIVKNNTIDETDPLKKLVVQLTRRKMLHLGHAGEKMMLRSWIQRVIRMPGLAADLMLSSLDSLLWIDSYADGLVYLTCPDDDCNEVEVMAAETHSERLGKRAQLKCIGCGVSRRINEWTMQSMPRIDDDD